MSEAMAYLAMLLLALAAAAVVTRPWWRRGLGGATARKAANIASYRTRLAELETEQAAGLIDAETSVALEKELGSRLLADADGSPQPTPPTPRRSGLAVVATTLALLLFAGGWYALGGSWRAQQVIASGGSAAPDAPDPAIAAMVEQLAQRMRAQPDDVAGWAMLGRSYFALQRYADAARAYNEANTRREATGQPPDAAGLVGEGEAIAFADGRQIPPAAAALFERALKLAPDDGKALWYGGLSAAQGGRLAEARARWQRLLKDAALPEPMRAVVRARVTELEGGSASEAVPPAGASTDNAVAPRLRVEVSLSPTLQAAVPEGATLFVFAKAAEGPPMPLAVQRLPVSRFPVSVVLDDSMAMAPALRLSQFSRYVVTARVSASGAAQAQAGDPEGSVEVARVPGEAVVRLVIDRRHP